MMKSIIRYTAPTALAFVALLFVVSCRPEVYCVITNATDQRVKIDFTFEGSGTLLPHFTLSPNESRRVKAGAIVSARDAAGHLIGTLDLSVVASGTRYYSPEEPYTFHLRVTRSGITPVKPPHQSSNQAMQRTAGRPAF